MKSITGSPLSSFSPGLAIKTIQIEEEVKPTFYRISLDLGTAHYSPLQPTIALFIPILPSIALHRPAPNIFAKNLEPKRRSKISFKTMEKHENLLGN